jgi:hypothetical protein
MIYKGLFVWSAMAPLTLAVLLAVLAAFWRRTHNSGKYVAATRYTYLLLAIGTVLSLIWHAQFSNEIPFENSVWRWQHSLHVLALTLVAVHGFCSSRIKAVLFVSLLCVFAVTGCLVIYTRPVPPIDTWYFQQAGARLFSQGRNPYTAAFDIPYPPWQINVFYGPGVVENGRLMSYAYPPLNLLVQLPFFLILGDIRYSILLGVILSALFMRALAPRRHRAFAEMAALFLVFEPTTLFVVRQAWTEPIVLAFWSAALLATKRALPVSNTGAPNNSPWVAGIALGLLAAIKQYSLIMLIPALLPTAMLKRPSRQILIALTCVSITILPFLLWNPHEFLRDVAFYQFRQPFRLDAMSALAAIARLRHVTVLPALALLPAFLLPWVIFFAARPKPGRIDQIASTTAAGFLVFIFLNKQSFHNYYWLALGLLCATCAANATRGDATRADLFPGAQVG